MAVQYSLSPEEVKYFHDQGNRARRDASSASAGLFLNRARMETDYGRTFGGLKKPDGTFTTSMSLGGGAFGKLGDAFKDARDRLSQPLAKRGVLNSGIMTDTVNRHFKAKNTAFEDLELKFGRTRQDLDLSREGIGQRLADALADIESDKGLRRSVMAAMIGEA
jgi:hypothetical protein